MRKIDYTRDCGIVSPIIYNIGAKCIKPLNINDSAKIIVNNYSEFANMNSEQLKNIRITNYNPEIQGAKGIDIDPSRVEQIKADIKASIERNIPWAVSNTYLSNVGKVVPSAKPQNQRHTQDEIDTVYNKLLDDEKAQVSAYMSTGKTKEEALEVMNKLKQGGKID